MSTEPIKFLLVDDTEANLIALEVLLRREGLEVLTASSGAEALELLLVHEVALAFIDVHMPNIDGFELAELMRGSERTKHVPIIFVTAGAKDPTRVFKGYESGAVDFLFKPIEPHVLKGKADVFFELYRQRRELSDALRLNEMFVGILGHDLRNPLGAMVMGARLLEQQLQEPDQLRTLRRMTSAGQRMTVMIEQLLDLTRARLAGGIGFISARQRFDVGGLVQRAAEELRDAHADRKVVVSITGDCMISGDPDRLLQLFSNLIANALLHGAGDTPVSIEVTGQHDHIVVSVQNQGLIPPELIPTLFDPFRNRQQASSSRGLGLGLFIAREIALAHGGSVSVASASDTGTTLTVRLPR
jgi:signal transduction histidine kinase